MSVAWVAASVRARAIARRRLGLVAIARLRQAGSLPAARARLADTAYARAATCPDLASAQRAVAASVLWEIRILAGWMPSGGTPIARAVVAAFERENCHDHLRRVTARSPGLAASVPEPFDLGSLATAWHRVRSTTTAGELGAELAASPWGEVPVEDPAALRDALAAAWLRRAADDIPGVEPLAVSAAVLLVARTLLLEGRLPGDRACTDLNALLGSRWSTAGSIEDLRGALDRPARQVLAGVAAPDQLWRAEVALWQAVADTGARLLRDPLPGPHAVVGAITQLAADAFWVRGALAVSAVGGEEEVLHGVA